LVNLYVRQSPERDIDLKLPSFAPLGIRHRTKNSTGPKIRHLTAYQLIGMVSVKENFMSGAVTKPVAKAKKSTVQRLKITCKHQENPNETNHYRL
jgi:hypothetical protein